MAVPEHGMGPWQVEEVEYGRGSRVARKTKNYAGISEKDFDRMLRADWNGQMPAQAESSRERRERRCGRRQ